MTIESYQNLWRVLKKNRSDISQNDGDRKFFLQKYNY